MYEKLVSYAAKQLELNPEDITPESTFESLGIDSLDIVELIMALEEEFDLQIPDSEAEKIATVGDVIEYIKNNDFEYFVKDGQVLLCGWGYDGFEQVDGEWFFVLDGECNTKMTMTETLDNEKDLLKSEHKCLPAKFLIFYNDITDAEKFEQAKECPYFHCVFSVDEDI